MRRNTFYKNTDVLQTAPIQDVELFANDSKSQDTAVLRETSLTHLG